MKLKNIAEYIRKYYLFILFGVITLVLPDIMIKDLLGQGFFAQGYVGVVSWLFTIFWIMFVVAISTVVMPKKWGKTVFAVGYPDVAAKCRGGGTN